MKCHVCGKFVERSLVKSTEKWKRAKEPNSVFHILKKFLPNTILESILHSTVEIFSVSKGQSNENQNCHYNILSSQSNDWQFNCCYDGSLDIAWQYLNCSNNNSSDGKVCGVKIVKQSSLFQLPDTLIWTVS